MKATIGMKMKVIFVTPRACADSKKVWIEKYHKISSLKAKFPSPDTSLGVNFEFNDDIKKVMRRVERDKEGE